MSDDSYLLDNKSNKGKKTWLARIFKIIFIVSACVLVGITVLSNMGGSSPSLKSSVEQFMSSIFQDHPVEVESLVYMGFFPRMGFDIENTKVISSPEEGYKIAEIGKFQFFMRFWDVAFRKPRISHFYMEDFKAIKGFISPKEIYIERVFIDHDAENQTAELKGNGTIGDHALLFVIDVEVLEAQDFWRTKGHFSYTLAEEFPFVIDIADINIKGNLLKHKSGYYKFKDLKISSGDKEIRGNIVLYALGRQLLKLKGEIDISEDSVHLSPDLIFDYGQEPVKISGEVIDNKSIDFFFNKLQEIIGYKAKYNWETK